MWSRHTEALCPLSFVGAQLHINSVASEWSPFGGRHQTRRGKRCYSPFFRKHTRSSAHCHCLARSPTALTIGQPPTVIRPDRESSRSDFCHLQIPICGSAEFAISPNSPGRSCTIPG